MGCFDSEWPLRPQDGPEQERRILSRSFQEGLGADPRCQWESGTGERPGGVPVPRGRQIGDRDGPAGGAKGRIVGWAVGPGRRCGSR